MAANSDGVETRPSKSVAETRVGDVNRDEETKVKAGKLAEGVDKDTVDLIVHDTTTRERTVNAKRAHEPLDLDLADDDQPEEDGNGPRADEVNSGDGPTASVSSVKVTEAQVKAGAKAK